MNWKVGEKIFLTGDIFPVNPELTLVGVFNDPNTSETLFFSQTYLREMRPEELRGAAGTYRLREELLARVMPAVAPAKVTDVLFTEMLVQ